MTESLKVSERMLSTLERTIQSNATLLTQPLGSTNPVGNLTTLPDPLEVLPPEMQMPSESPKTLGSIASRLPNGKPPQTESSARSSAVKYSKEEKAQFTIALMQVFQMLKEYGKQGQDFDVIVQGFLAFFERKGYGMQTIIDAMFQHLDRSKEIPTPADIESIINPPPPKIDWALYIEIKKRMREGRVYVDRDEKQYIRDCEEIGVNRMRGEMENYKQAQGEIEKFDALRLEHFE